MRKQLEFLERSSKSFDDGHQDEAIRIAQVLRVMFHQTGKSNSIITHLGSPEIELVSTAPRAPTAGKLVHLHSLVNLNVRLGVDGGVAKNTAPLDDGPFREMVSLDSWWNQLVFVRGDTQASRKAIILGAANKDGGSHVDPKLTPAYQLAINSRLYITIETIDGELVELTDEGAHLVSIRQMAHEVLSSPDIKKLAGVDTTD